MEALVFISFQISVVLISASQFILRTVCDDEQEISTFAAYVATVLSDEFIISCGGSIISTRTVLTSARCLLPSHTIYIIAGSTTIEQNSLTDPKSQLRIATKMKIHEMFRRESPYEFDVGLVSFSEELTFGATISSIQLTSYWARVEDTVFVFGWEPPAPGDNTMKLKQTQTSIACRSWGKVLLPDPGAWDNLMITTDSVLFAKDKVSSASICYGFAGSPMVVEGKQVGIASHGIDPDCQGLNAFASIRRHIRWIEKNKSLLEGQTLRNANSPLRENSIAPRIANGSIVEDPERFPFMAGIAAYVSDEPAKFQHSNCGGSILTPWIILTAAHCIPAGEAMIVYAGILDQSKFTAEGASYQAVKVAKSRAHPNYTSPKKAHDIGLVLLSEPLNFNARVAPVCQLAKEYPETNTSLLVAGWGRLKNKTIPDYLSWTTMRVLGRMSQVPGSFFLDSMTTSAEKGDSGGPFFTEEHEVAGVVSFTWFQSRVAASTAEHLDWIFDTLHDLEGMMEDP